MVLDIGSCLALGRSNRNSQRIAQNIGCLERHETCVKRPYTTRHILAFQTGGCFLLHESSAKSSALLSFSQKQPPVNSDFHVNGCSLKTGLTERKENRGPMVL